VLDVNVAKFILRGIPSLFFRLGYEKSFSPDLAKHPEHELVKPRATYSPWLEDEAFKKLFNSVAPLTKVDRYRCYELWTLVEQASKLEGSLIEVGTWRGGTGAILAGKADLCGIDDPVYLCDTFEGVVKAGPKDSKYKGGEHADTSIQQVEELIHERLHLENVRILQGIFPEESSHLIEDSRFRLCHIDVDVYQSARDIVDWIWDRMVVGGLIIYDDYGFSGTDGITKHVDEQRGLSDRLVIHNLNGHAVIIKIG